MRRLARIFIVATAMLVAVGVGMPTATAAPETCPHRFGSPQQLKDTDGAVVQQWSVTDLRASTDPVPGYPLAGRLWEATGSVEALSGTVTPIIPNVYAVSASGERYQVLWQVASPNAISGATINQGQASKGKLYFDVTGAEPMAVIYSNGGSHPAMMWCCNGNMMMPMEMPMPMPMHADADGRLSRLRRNDVVAPSSRGWPCDPRAGWDRRLCVQRETERADNWLLHVLKS